MRRHIMSIGMTGGTIVTVIFAATVATVVMAVMGQRCDPTIDTATIIEITLCLIRCHAVDPALGSILASK